MKIKDMTITADIEANVQHILDSLQSWVWVWMVVAAVYWHVSTINQSSPCLSPKKYFHSIYHCPKYICHWDNHETFGLHLIELQISPIWGLKEAEKHYSFWANLARVTGFNPYSLAGVTLVMIVLWKTYSIYQNLVWSIPLTKETCSKIKKHLR